MRGKKDIVLKKKIKKRERLDLFKKAKTGPCGSENEVKIVCLDSNFTLSIF